jgi:acetyl esterase/lipase
MKKLSHLISLLIFLSVFAAYGTASVFKDLVFATVDDRELKLDLYLPESAENPPLVVWIHGGGWSGGNKKWCPVKWLADHGYAVASVSYRFSQQAKFPAQIHDVKAAVRWLRANAEQYGYDPERIAASGASAGGHLAALLGVTAGVGALEGEVGEHLDESSKVNVVINYYGASDFILRSRTQPERANAVGSVVYELLGGPASVLTEKAVLASPAFYVTRDDPPLMIVHGVDDKTVLIDQAVRLFTCYLEAGLPVELHALEGLGHGGDEFYTGTNRQLVLDFLEKHL